MTKIKVERMLLGAIRTNCYIAYDEDSKKAVIVDPAEEGARIVKKIQQLSLIPQAILLTHGHADHIGAAAGVAKAYQIPIYAGEHEIALLASAQLNLSCDFGNPMVLKEVTALKDGEKLSLADCEIEVLETPGHTSGGVCYYLPLQGICFCGDTIFRCSIGRTDFPGGSMSQIVRSIREKIFLLPDQTILYPGHEQETTVEYEKKYNPYL